MRLSSSDVFTPGVRHVGRNLPADGVKTRCNMARCGRRRTLALDDRVYVVAPSADVRVLVARDVVDVVLVDERLIDGPWRLAYDLFDPAAVIETLSRLHGVPASAHG
jgi:hypothetical protein